MSREEQDKDGFLPPKKFAMATLSKEEKPKPNRLASNSFYLLSKEIKYHTIPSYILPERQRMDTKDKEELKPDGAASSGVTGTKNNIQEPTFCQLMKYLDRSKCI